MATITTASVNPFTSLQLWGAGSCPVETLTFGNTGDPTPPTVTNTSLSYEQGLKFYWLINSLTLSTTMTFNSENEEVFPSQTLTTLTTFRRQESLGLGSYSTTPQERVCPSRNLTSGGEPENLDLFYISGEERLHWEASVINPDFGNTGLTEEWGLLITTADIDLSYALGSAVYSDYTIPITLDIFGGITLYVHNLGIDYQVENIFILDSAEIVSAEICEIAG